MQAWRRADSVLLCVKSESEKEIAAKLQLDVAGLEVNVRKLWKECASSFALDDSRGRTSLL